MISGIQQKLCELAIPAVAVLFLAHVFGRLVIDGAADGWHRYYYFYLGILSGLQLIILYRWYRAMKDEEDEAEDEDDGEGL